VTPPSSLTLSLALRAPTALQDYYEALYTQSKVTFGGYVEAGTVGTDLVARRSSPAPTRSLAPRARSFARS